ncbi:MAG: bacteriohemerythrin [Planctomycetota bacterium]
MPFVWDQSFATGSIVVDNQHKELFRQIAGLSDAMKAGKGRDELKKLVNFLGDYVVKHFTEEEAIMEKCKSPIAAANKRAHAEFLERFQQLRTKFESGSASVSVVLEIHDLVNNWLIKHIKAIDTQLDKSLNASNREPVAAMSK